MSELFEFSAESTPYLFGHEEVQEAVVSAINTGTLHHGIILAGPEGIGKSTLAYHVARTLLDYQGGDGGLFGPAEVESLSVSDTHPVFRKVAGGSHPDLLILKTREDEKTGKMQKFITVDDARKVASFLSLTPAESQYRVVIIDSVDEMNVNAANAILKILEEPPRNAYLILLSHSVGKLLPTIRSRCRTFKLSPLSDDAFSKALKTYLPDIKDEDIATLRLFANGAPGKAMVVHHYHGEALYHELLQLLALVPDLDMVRVHKLADKLAAKNDPYVWKLSIMLLQHIVHSVVLGSATGNVGTVLGQEQQVVRALILAKPIVFWLHLWDQIAVVARDVERLNADKKLAVVNLFASLVVDDC